MEHYDSIPNHHSNTILFMAYYHLTWNQHSSWALVRKLWKINSLLRKHSINNYYHISILYVMLFILFFHWYSIRPGPLNLFPAVRSSAVRFTFIFPSASAVIQFVGLFSLCCTACLVDISSPPVRGSSRSNSQSPWGYPCWSPWVLGPVVVQLASCP